MSSSGRWTSSRPRSGWTGPSSGARNFVQPDQFPYENPSGLFTASGGAKIAMDSGNYEPALDKALEMAGYGELAAKQGGGKSRGKLLGVGLSTYIEVCGVAPSKWIGAVGEGWGAAMWESANIKMHLTGKTVVTMGTQPQGQGHETTYSQVVSHELGIPMEDIVVQHSDTQGTPFGYGSYGSRTSSVGMTAAIKASGKIREKARRFAAHMLEASVDDIEIDGANYFVRAAPTGSRRSRRSPSRSTSRFDPPEGMEPYLDETAYYDTPNCTWPFGTHIAIVEIDEDTGNVELVRYVAVDDVGKKINPMIVDGQLHGGIAQGVGQALWEGAVYSDEGQLLYGLDARLRGAARVMLPAPRARRDGHAVAGQPDRRQGRRRGGRDREHGRGRQRGHRRTQPTRHPTSRHAVHPADRLAGDADRKGRPGMIPAAFDYQRASTIDEALGALSSGDGSVKLLAGGQSLLPLLKMRLAFTDKLVDIGRIAELNGVRQLDGGGLAIGALTTLRRADRFPGRVVRRSSRRPSDHRRPSGPQPGDRRRRHRACRSGVRPAGLPARTRRRDRRPLLARRAGHPDRWLLRGAVPDRPRRRRDPDRDPAARRAGRRRFGLRVARTAGVRVRARRRGGCRLWQRRRRPWDRAARMSR